MADGWGLVRNWVVKKHFVLARAGTLAFKADDKSWQSEALSVSGLGYIPSLCPYFFFPIMELVSCPCEAWGWDSGGVLSGHCTSPSEHSVHPGCLSLIQGWVWWARTWYSEALEIQVLRDNFHGTHGKEASHWRWLSEHSVSRKCCLQWLIS